MILCENHHGGGALPDTFYERAAAAVSLQPPESLTRSNRREAAGRFHSTGQSVIFFRRGLAGCNQ
jgi:hypothetical protein